VSPHVDPRLSEHFVGHVKHSTPSCPNLSCDITEPVPSHKVYMERACIPELHDDLIRLSHHAALGVTVHEHNYSRFQSRTRGEQIDQNAEDYLNVETRITAWQTRYSLQGPLADDMMSVVFRNLPGIVEEQRHEGNLGSYTDAVSHATTSKPNNPPLSTQLPPPQRSAMKSGTSSTTASPIIPKSVTIVTPGPKKKALYLASRKAAKSGPSSVTAASPIPPNSCKPGMSGVETVVSTPPPPKSATSGAFVPAPTTPDPGMLKDFSPSSEVFRGTTSSEKRKRSENLGIKYIGGIAFNVPLKDPEPAVSSESIESDEAPEPKKPKPTSGTKKSISTSTIRSPLKKKKKISNLRRSQEMQSSSKKSKRPKVFAPDTLNASTPHTPSAPPASHATPQAQVSHATSPAARHTSAARHPPATPLATSSATSPANISPPVKMAWSITVGKNRQKNIQALGEYLKIPNISRMKINEWRRALQDYINSHQELFQDNVVLG
jgi:hypothetical protein